MTSSIRDRCELHYLPSVADHGPERAAYDESGDLIRQELPGELVPPSAATRSANRSGGRTPVLRQS